MEDDSSTSVPSFSIPFIRISPRVCADSMSLPSVEKTLSSLFCSLLVIILVCSDSFAEFAAAAFCMSAANLLFVPNAASPVLSFFLSVLRYAERRRFSFVYPSFGMFRIVSIKSFDCCMRDAREKRP